MWGYDYWKDTINIKYILYTLLLNQNIFLNIVFSKNYDDLMPFHFLSSREDFNLRLLRPEHSALQNCAMPRYNNEN